VSANAGRARRVWQAAFPNHALDDAAAAELGTELENTAKRYLVISAKRPAGEHRKQKNIELSAGRLLTLLSRTPDEILNRIEQFCALDADWLFDLRNILRNLQAGAKEAQKHGSGTKALWVGIGSPERWLLGKFQKIYERRSGRMAGRSRVDGELRGPFLRFVQEAAREFGIAPPSPETIGLFLRKGMGMGG
jgi:hypothetical protein